MPSRPPGWDGTAPTVAEYEDALRLFHTLVELEASERVTRAWKVLLDGHSATVWALRKEKER